MKEVLSKLIHKAAKKLDVSLEEEEILDLIEKPKDYSLGDFAFPCFILAKKIKNNPHDVALDLRQGIKKIPEGFGDVQVVGPYVNFFLDRNKLAKDVVLNAIKKGDDFGKNDSGKGKKIFVEFSSPNIAKPFGIGHLRSTIIGSSIAKISEFNGYGVIRANYLGDWGTQFGKLIHAYELFGNSNKLKKDPIKHLYEIYVKINKDKKYEEKSREWFKKLEEGDEEATRLWKDFREFSIEDFKKIYSIFGVDFDVYLGESMYNDKMKKVIQELSKKKLLVDSEGARIVDLEKEGLGVAIMQKSDGTTIYATRDLASAISRYEEYKFDKMFYEVGQEQTLHFKQIFKVLEKMGYKWSKNCVHISHGLYLGKDGKRLATREGKTIFMEDILNETKDLTAKEIKKRFPKISKKDLNERAMKVAIAAIFYGDLKNTRTNNIVFDLERFTSFEGDTGPYIQYAYARASSILRKIKDLKKFEMPLELEEKEIDLVLKLNEFEKVVIDSYRQLNPALIANYSYKLAQIFNEFYHASPVIGSDSEAFRVHLIQAFRQVLKNSLKLLGIETLEEM